MASGSTIALGGAISLSPSALSFGPRSSVLVSLNWGGHPGLPTASHPEECYLSSRFILLPINPAVQWLERTSPRVLRVTSP